GAGDLVAARRLDVEDGALDDSLEAAGRGWVGRAVGDPCAEFAVEILLDRGLEVVAVDAAAGHHLAGMGVVDQSNQQMFERRIFMAPLRRFAERIVQGSLKFTRETGHSGLLTR